MNKIRPRNWPGVLSYLIVCFAVLGILFWVAEWFFPPTSAELIPRNDALSSRFISDHRSDHTNLDRSQKAPAERRAEKIRLMLNQEKKFGKSKIVYRGLDGNSNLKIDVVILDLDPDAYYPYRINTNEAKNGFRLAGNNFKLISARKSVIQFWHFNKQ
jgi:hypothetical protein